MHKLHWDSQCDCSFFDSAVLRSVFVHQNVVHCELISCFDGCKERRVFGKRHSVALGQLQCTRWQRAIPFGVENCNGAPATSEMEMLYTDAGLIRSTCISSRAWSFNVAQLLRLRGASRCNGHMWPAGRKGTQSGVAENSKINFFIKLPVFCLLECNSVICHPTLGTFSPSRSHIQHSLSYIVWNFHLNWLTFLEAVTMF